MAGCVRVSLPCSWAMVAGRAPFPVVLFFRCLGCCQATGHRAEVHTAGVTLCPGKAQCAAAGGEKLAPSCCLVLASTLC